MSHKQLVRRARSTMKKQRPCETLAKDITCKGEQEPTQEQLGTLTLHMQDTFKRQLIFRVFAKRIGDSGSLWTHPLKVLHVFEYMLRQGHSVICADIYMFREHIKSLSAFTHYEVGMDRGAVVRDKARAVLHALDRWAAEDNNTGLISSTSSYSTTTTPRTPPTLSPETGFHNFSSPHVQQLPQPSPQQPQQQTQQQEQQDLQWPEDRSGTGQGQVVPPSSRIEQQRRAYRLQQQRSQSLDEDIVGAAHAEFTATPTARPSSPGYDPPHVRQHETCTGEEAQQQQQQHSLTRAEAELGPGQEPFYMPLPPSAGMPRASGLAPARVANGGVAALRGGTEHTGGPAQQPSPNDYYHHQSQHQQYPQPPPPLPAQAQSPQHYHHSSAHSQQQSYASSEQAALEEAKRRSVLDARAQEHREREQGLEDYHLQLVLELSRVEQ